MAAEVPAKDVLCEAMEYLSKLGSNLRTRSESLREKKIRREKLNNVLALQKAAKKVLLICELSKKSLENVETGIRKVLNVIDTSQASSKDGGKKSKSEYNDVESKTHYYYFEYRSRKLKIKKRISLKHFTSVRVMAKIMPKSMIDIYPVHYDCKLYRTRQKELKSLESTAESDKCEKGIKDDTTSVHNKENPETSKKNQDVDISVLCATDTTTSKSVSIDKNVNDNNAKIPDGDLSVSKDTVDSELPLEKLNKEKRRTSSEKLSIKGNHRGSSEQSQKRTKTKDVLQTDMSEKKKTKDMNEKTCFESSRQKHRNSSETSHMNEDGKKKFKKLRVIEDSSEDEEEKSETYKKRLVENNAALSPKTINSSEEDKYTVNDNDKRSIVNMPTLPSKNCIYNSDNEQGMERNKKSENIETPLNYINDDVCHEPSQKRRKLSVSSNETQTEDVKEKFVLDDNDSAKKKQQNADNECKKPIIKCVSLTKLLKPDILVKKPHLSDITSYSAPKDSYSNKNKAPKLVDNEVKKDKRSTATLTIEKREEEEYWSIKRKEVKSFHSKTFVINITRLPQLSIDYIKKLSLRRITQGGVTICEIPDNNKTSNDLLVDKSDTKDKENETLTSEMKRTNKKCVEVKIDTINNSGHDEELIAEANKVKNSLLNESDSDDDIMGVADGKTDKKNTDNFKIALLNDSDSENYNSEDGLQSTIINKKVDNTSISCKAQKAKKALCSDSNSESDKNELNQTAQAEEVENERSNDNDSGSRNKYMSETARGEEIEIAEPDSDKIPSQTPQAEEAMQRLLQKSISETEIDTMTLQYESDSDTRKKGETSNFDKTNSATSKSKNDSSDSTKDNDSKENNEEYEQDDLVKNTEENLPERQSNEKTPEKESSLAGDSDDKTKTPLSQRLTPQSKKKRIRESVHAKKMLLTYSSSDTEDEELKNALKEIKDALLHGSDEETSAKKQEQKHSSKETSPCSSAEDILKKVKRKITYDSSPSKEKRVKRKKHCRRLDSDDSENEKSDYSKSSSGKMVRSKSKPGNSSSQNSDAQDSNDKDIDGLTNLNNLNKSKTRRRNSSTSEMTEESSVSNRRSRRSRVKPTGLICEEMLKAESSSDASVSVEENDDDNDQELPTVTLPNFNGGVEHLVKEDLLEESDSSGTHDEDANKDDSESEEKLNARRRKANAISSDSEVGSSRKKDANFKLSDFEDTEDSEPNTRTKRKKKGSDSDASVGSNSSNDGGKKKRRRIKSVKDSDMSGSDSENEGRNKHGRKNIRKVMGKNQLEEATKKAAREEKERIARIAERQKMYNNLEFDESGKPDEVVLEKVVLDFDPETKEPLIEVDRGLVKKLKPHQANGIKFMWNACFESVKRIKKDKGSGCILAHCMGLGKTLQVVSLTHTLLIHEQLTGVNRVLVVCPLSTVLNWVNEFKMWLKHADTDFEVDVYEISRYKQNSERSFQLSQWFQHGGVCVLGYEMFRNLSADNSKKFKKKMLKNFQEALVDPGPDLVVCDEGHLLKNEKTSLSQSMNRVRTLRRIVLTGTPLQNNLKEYYCMVQFVKPNLLGKYNEYLNRFVNPITNGQYTDSTEHDIKIMKRRSHVLHTMLDGAVQRRDYGVLAPFLPPKHEYVLFITLSEVQTKLYQHYLDNLSRRPLPGKSSGFLFPDFQSLQRIWTHPLVLKYNSERYEIMQQKKRDKEDEDSEGSLVDFIDDDSTPNETSTEESSDDSSLHSDDSRKKSKKKKSSKKSKGKDKEVKGEGGQSGRPRRGTRANPIELDDDENIEEINEVKNENPTEWWIKLVEEEVLDDMRHSHKLVLLFDILRQCEAIGDKLLVFSQSLYSLDLIEHFLGKVDEATQEGRIDEKLGGHVGSWSPGIDYFRLDGSTSCENRSIWCKNFNREDNPRARLFLISTRAGGLGINLVAANRVVIFDVSWNPSHDVQSIFRVYRFGQKKPCYVYRFLAMGTMEEKIYERQVTKQAISKRVIDEQQIDRHYAENDLAELYKFEPQPPVPRPIPPLPKDRLFAEMLREHEVQIYKYHEHDSLLENKEEETLSEEERKAAWEDFENEKNKPPPAPFPNPWPMHNGMVPSLLAQQQQQLAYAALAAMLRKDMPNLNDNQLRDMLPLIYNANPQLMQKMSEIYKYTQPGMMNPAMMNPGVMNPASGAGPMGAMSGASGLQYEPPWQRQQHQQQQMRLQQLMQQQNNQMGAKFYAGGLGSRDPVAMALQQQRAREIMLGNSNAAAAARPRGRPPLQPHAPSADVVDLDSD